MEKVMARADILPAWTDYIDHTQLRRPNISAAIDQVADDFMHHGNTAFREVQPVRGIGIASGGPSAHFLPGTLQQVIRRAEAMEQPPAVGVLVNYTPGCYDELAQQNIATIRAIQEAHPWLPLSYSEMRHAAKTPIGDIREVTLSGMGRAHELRARAAGVAMADMLLTTMDSDTVGISQRYFVQSQQEYERSSAPYWTSAPFTRHDRPGKDFPAANALLGWYDLRTLAVHGVAPANFSINLLGLAATGGGFGGKAFGEYVEVQSRLENVAGKGALGPIFRPEQVVTNSSYALVGKMARNERLEYKGKHSDASSALHADGSPVFTGLEQDIPRTYFNVELTSLIGEVFSGVGNGRWDELVSRKVPEEAATDAAIRYAAAYVRAAAIMLGDHHGTDNIVRATAAQYGA